MTDLVEAELTNNYEKYYRLVFSYTHNEADALDAVQEGAYKAIKKANTIKDPQYISTWIYRIMINEAIGILRKNKKFKTVDSTFEEGKNDNYADLDLQNAIEKLELTDQTIIKLRYFEEMPLKEIASILSTNENTVKSRLYRTLDKLKTDLEVK